MHMLKNSTSSCMSYPKYSVLLAARTLGSSSPSGGVWRAPSGVPSVEASPSAWRGCDVPPVELQGEV